MLYFYIKIAHILSMSLFFGAGLGSALVKIRADRTRDPAVVGFAMRHIVWADWLFTVPSGVALPVTGLWLCLLTGIPWTHGWVAWGIGLYALAGACWLPAAWLQIRMRKCVEQSVRKGRDLPPEYWRWTRIWFGLGVPAFLATMAAIYVMVLKPV